MRLLVRLLVPVRRIEISSRSTDAPHPTPLDAPWTHPLVQLFLVHFVHGAGKALGEAIG